MHHFFFLKHRMEVVWKCIRAGMKMTWQFVCRWILHSYWCLCYFPLHLFVSSLIISHITMWDVPYNIRTRENFIATSLYAFFRIAKITIMLSNIHILTYVWEKKKVYYVFLSVLVKCITCVVWNKSNKNVDNRASKL